MSTSRSAVIFATPGEMSSALCHDRALERGIGKDTRLYGRVGARRRAVVKPDPANLAHDTAAWVSWWTPGQYVWPGIFLAAGLNLAGSLVVSALLAAWIRSAGFFLLLRSFEFSPRAAALAALVEAASW